MMMSQNPIENNIKSAKEIGNHTFWWDKKHK